MARVAVKEIGNLDSISGVIVAWVGGYFGNSSNGSYTRTLGASNDVAGANAYLNPFGYYVCNGAALNDSGSPIFNGVNRYLPNITDARFLMGNTSVGTIGGSNTLTDHTHTFSLSMAHTHTINHDHGSFSSTTDGDHGHGINIDYVASAVATSSGGGYLKASSSQLGRKSTPEGPITLSSAIVSSGGHAHTVDVPSFSGSSGSASTSTVGGSVGSGSAAASTENRPKYLGCMYIMKIK